jgi:hypothetical protein
MGRRALEAGYALRCYRPRAASPGVAGRANNLTSADAVVSALADMTERTLLA